MDIAAIRTAIAANLATIPGLKAHPRWPDALVPPAAIVMTPAGNYRQDLGGSGMVNVEVLLLVSPLQQGLAKGQARLDAYLATGGTYDVRAAIESDKDLNGAAHTLSVVGWRDAGALNAGGVEYVGARIDVEVWAA